MAESDTVATSTISVHAAVWPDPELAAMVAPPVVVTAWPVERLPDARRLAQLARSRGNMPVGRHRGGNR